MIEPLLTQTHGRHIGLDAHFSLLAIRVYRVAMPGDRDGLHEAAGLRILFNKITTGLGVSWREIGLSRKEEWQFGFQSTTITDVWRRRRKTEVAKDRTKGRHDAWR